MNGRSEISFVGPSLPLLVVEDVGACRDFWVNALGFKLLVAEPAGPEPEFIVLQREATGSDGASAPVVLEYQRYDGLSDAVKATIPAGDRAVVYIWLSHGLGILHAALLRAAPSHVIETRTAPYNADEVVVRDPHGHVFIFGQRRPAA